MDLNYALRGLNDKSSSDKVNGSLGGLMHEHQKGKRGGPTDFESLRTSNDYAPEPLRRGEKRKDYFSP